MSCIRQRCLPTHGPHEVPDSRAVLNVAGMHLGSWLVGPQPPPTVASFAPQVLWRLLQTWPRVLLVGPLPVPDGEPFPAPIGHCRLQLQRPSSLLLVPPNLSPRRERIQDLLSGLDRTAYSNVAGSLISSSVSRLRSISIAEAPMLARRWCRSCWVRDDTFIHTSS